MKPELFADTGINITEAFYIMCDKVGIVAVQISDAHFSLNPGSDSDSDSDDKDAAYAFSRGILYFALAGPIFVLCTMMGKENFTFL